MALAMLLMGAGLSSCTPTYNWREVRGDAAPYLILMPAKAASMAREIDLDGTRVLMSMRATQIEGIRFAVGSARLSDAAATPAALKVMQHAMVRNIHGTVLRQQTITGSPGSTPLVEIEASGTDAAGRPLYLSARFAARGGNVYQAVVLGREQDWPRDAVEVFLASFKPG